MAAGGKQTVLNILKRDQKKFFELVENPGNWEVQTRCTVQRSRVRRGGSQRPL